MFTMKNLNKKTNKQTMQLSFKSSTAIQWDLNSLLLVSEIKIVLESWTESSYVPVASEQLWEVNLSDCACKRVNEM